MRIRHSRPMLGVDEDRAACRALASGHVARGPESTALERELGERLGAPFVRLTSSGTTALHVALMAVGVKAGDEVILPSYVCAAVLHAIRHAGAVPVPADVDAETLGLTAASVEAVRTSRLRAIVAVHPFGRMIDLERLRGFGVPVVEDLAMALGACGPAGPAGSLGSVAVCSFYATKMITTGHGGCVATASEPLHGEVTDLTDYDGRDRDRIRYNYSMSDVCAAIGRIQLGRLDEFVRARRRLAGIYAKRLAGAGVCAPAVPAGPSHVFYRYLVRVPGGRRDEVARRLQDAGIEAKKPVYQTVHGYLGLDARRFPGAESADREVLSLPVHPGVAGEEAEETAERLLECLHETGSN